MSHLVVLRKPGLYCPKGDFYIDPDRKVDWAVVTHGHADHVRPGAQQYLCVESSEPIIRHRLGKKANIRSVPFGQKIEMGDVQISFHPAGHILGSAQVRIDDGESVWVASGDYKRSPDPTCETFEVVPCDVFITEATFGLPIYRWDPAELVARDILEWWDGCVSQNQTALLVGYTLGKSQRLLAELAQFCNRPVYIHPYMEPLMALYREQGVKMLETITLTGKTPISGLQHALVLAPPSALRTNWMWQFDAVSIAFASGWMRLRDHHSGRTYDRGFVLSDHADWPELVQTVQDTGASKIYVTHGSDDIFARYLQEQGHDAESLDTLYEAVV